MEQCNRRLSVSALNTAEFEGLTNRCDTQNCNKGKHEIEDELYFNPNNQEPLKISCFKVHLYFWFQSEILSVLRGVFVGIAGLFFFLSHATVAGDVLHGSSGPEDPLETDGFSAGAAFSRQSRSVSLSFCMWLRSRCAVFPLTKSVVLNSPLHQGVTLTPVICHLQRRWGIKTDHNRASETACKTPFDGCSQCSDPHIKDEPPVPEWLPQQI